MKKVYESQYYPVMLSVVTWIATTINPGLGFAMVAVASIFWAYGENKNWFNKV